MTTQNVAGPHVEGLELRGIMPASEGWRAEYYNQRESRWESVPILAWGVDPNGEIRPLTRVAPGVLKVLQDEVGDEHVRIVDPDGVCVDDQDKEPTDVGRIYELVAQAKARTQAAERRRAEQQRTHTPPSRPGAEPSHTSVPR